MIYWRTDAYITSPLTLFAYLVHKTNRFHMTVVCLVINHKRHQNKCHTRLRFPITP